MKNSLHIRFNTVIYCLNIKPDITAYESAIISELAWAAKNIGQDEEIFFNERYPIIYRHFILKSIDEREKEVISKPKISWVKRLFN